MVEIGNNSYATLAQQAIDRQNDPRLTWDIIAAWQDMGYSRMSQGVKTVGYAVAGTVNNPSNFKFTDLVMLKSRFDLATTYKNAYNYGAYLFNEELASPIISASWFESKQALSTWSIDGSIILAGITIELIKTWYERTKGTWNSTWWSGVVASNNYNDSIIKEWNTYYTMQLLVAWKSHMTSMGKGTALVFWPINTTQLGTEYLKICYTTSRWNYILSNYDVIVVYKDPNTLSPTNLSTKQISTVDTERDVSALRAIYTGKIMVHLTTCYPDGWGCQWTEAVAFDEFKRAKSAGADIIVVSPSATMAKWNPNEIPYHPYLYKFCEATGGCGGIIPCPPSQCNFTITQ